MQTAALEQRYRAREARGFLRRMLEPPAPFVMNPREPRDFPLGRWNLYVGGAGRTVPGYVNLDLFPMPGVDVAADGHELPFAAARFQRIECDAVLEHVRDPERVVGELVRVLAPGGYLHLVTPFCHPFHEYPKDYRRFTLDGLKLLAPVVVVVAQGWRTGPAATLLVVSLEFAKCLLPWRWWRVLAHFTLGWLLFPLRYLDLALLKTARAGRIGNHCYLWLRKAE
jgi:SAM-dependent methyltransferase